MAITFKKNERACGNNARHRGRQEAGAAQKAGGQVPRRRTEYPCSYDKRRGTTTIGFTNQNGWRFEIKIGRGDEGTWAAHKDGDAVAGRAFSPFGD